MFLTEFQGQKPIRQDPVQDLDQDQDTSRGPIQLTHYHRGPRKKSIIPSSKDWQITILRHLKLPRSMGETQERDLYRYRGDLKAAVDLDQGLIQE